ncbi:MAG: calcium/proton exchanger [Verrucomicrobia bacterium]|nr:calcium/proton exchanger [Verrucomicrobiota bacterium]
MTGNNEGKKGLKHCAQRPTDWLLLAVPLAFAIDLIPGWKNGVVLFFVAGIAIIPLAAWLGRATEHLAARAGPAIGGLVNATFGNAPELILSLVALSKGLTVLVKASITGSIIGNILLVLGTAILAGGMRFSHQRFSQTGIRIAATALTLAVIGLIIPTIFHVTTGGVRDSVSSRGVQNLSVAVAVVLFATYFLWLIFSLITHKDLFAGENSQDNRSASRKKAPWPVPKAFTILVVAAILIAIMSEFLAGSVETTCKNLHLSELFVGVIIVAIIGNASESTAVLVAIKNQMDLALGITIGATLQVALFITPVLVFASYLIGPPMTLEFSLPEVAAITLAVGIVVLISGDGECNWLEGVQLIAVYAIIALFFYYLPESTSVQGRAIGKGRDASLQPGSGH